MKTEIQYIKALINEDINSAYKIFQESEFEWNLVRYGDLISANSILHLAVKKNRIDIVIDLLENFEANVNALNYYKDTPLILASETGAMNLVETLVTYGASINSKNYEQVTPIIKAAKNGYFQLVNYYISRGADVHSLDKKGNNPFFYAIKYGNFKLVKELSSLYYSTVAEIESNKYDPMLLAAESGNLKIFKYIVSLNKSPIDKEIKGENAIILASSKGHLEIVKYLAERCDIRTSTFFNDQKNIALLLAAKNGRLDVVEYLIKTCDVNPNYYQDSDYPAVVQAALNGSLNVVKYLCEEFKVNLSLEFEHGENIVTLVSKTGEIGVLKYLFNLSPDLVIRAAPRALIVATQKNHKIIVEFIMDNISLESEEMLENLFEIALNNRAITTAELILNRFPEIAVNNKNLVAEIIEIGIEEKNIQMIRLAINGFGFDVNQRINDSDNLLTLASKLEQTNLIKYLVNNFDINIDFQDSRGNTALMNASSNGNFEIVRFLLEHSADLTIENVRKNDALKLAIIKSHEDIVEYLVSNYPIQHTLENSSGNNILTLAISTDNLNIVKLLLDKFTFELNESNDQNLTPLMLAIENCSLKIVEELAGRGVDLNQKNIRGFTPIEVAAVKGYNEIVEFLLENYSGQLHLNQEFSLLDIASSTGNLELMKYLIAKGFETTKAMDLAVKNNHLSIVKYLLDESISNIEEQDSLGNTPLLEAVKMQNIAMIKFFVGRGASLNVRNKEEKNALELALENEGDFALDIVKFLVVDGGAKISPHQYDSIVWTLDPELEYHLYSCKLEHQACSADLESQGLIGEL